MASTQPRFPLMDSMRAIAAMAVVAFHVGLVFGVDNVPSTLRNFAGRLNVGVWIFFVISGFLLYRPFVAARMHAERSPALTGYAWRRFLRIFPAYWVALIVWVLWTHDHRVFTPIANGPRLLLLVQNYWSASFAHGLGQAWSLCVELAFYVLLGLLATMLLRTRKPTRAPLELGIVLLLAFVGLLFRWQMQSHGVFIGIRTMPWYLDTFAAGMALAVLSVHYENRRRPGLLRLIERFPVAPWALAALAYSLVATGVGLNGDPFQPIFPHTWMIMSALYTLVAVCVVVPAIWGDPGHGLVRRLLASRPLLFLGKVSYGIFLYQAVVILEAHNAGLLGVTVPHLSYLVWFCVVFGASTLLAVASWYVVEAPALRLKRLVSRSQGPALTPRALAPDPGAT